MNQVVRYAVTIAAGGAAGLVLTMVVGYIVLMFGGDDTLHHFEAHTP